VAEPLFWGLDAASEISLATLRAEGASFVCVYLAPGGTSSWKVRAPATIHAYLDAGLRVVFNWESDGTPGAGTTTGASAATQSQQQLENYRAHCEQCATWIPSGAPVIFTFADSAAPDRTRLAAAHDGAASVLGRSRCGGYGGVDTIGFLFDRSLITYGWQTYAWSGGRRDDRAQLYQRLNTATVDYDVAYATDYGQVPRPGGAGAARRQQSLFLT
jgi:hypothetical protein